MRSHTHEAVFRPYRSIVQDSPTTSNESHYFYKNLNDIIQRMNNLKSLENWNIEIAEGEIVLRKQSESYKSNVPELTITIDDGLGFTIEVFNYFIKEDHQVYKSYCRSMKNMTVSNLLKHISNHKVCKGINLVKDESSVYFHIVPLIPEKCINNEDEIETPMIPFSDKRFIRNKNCPVLSEEEISPECVKCELHIMKEVEKKKNHSNKPARTKAPLSKTNRGRIEAVLIEKRLECKALKKEIESMKTAIDKQGIDVDQELANDFDTIFTNSNNVTPFMKFFWQQQNELRKKGGGRNARYHPMIIRYCLSLLMKSRSAYEELRNSGVLILPSTRTLRDYKKLIKPKCGFSKEVIADLKTVTNNYFDVERYVVLLFDEMKIKSNLVFDKLTGEVKDYLDLGCVETDFSTLGNEHDDLSTHALVFYFRGVMADLKYAVAYFATYGIISIQLMGLFWMAVSILEDNCNLWVIAATSNGASPNRKFYQMHRAGIELCNKTMEIYIFLFRCPTP